MLAGGHAGVSRYTDALTRALDRVVPDFPELTLEAVTTRATAETSTFENIAVTPAGLPLGAEGRGWVRLLLEQAVARRRAFDLLHFFDLLGPVLARDQRFVTTLHDASIAHGFEFSRLRRTYKRRVQPWALRRAEAVVAVSAFARDEAVRLLGGEAARIRVIHSGPGLIEADEDDAPIAGQPRPYLLFVGTLADNKNLPFLVRAFDRSGADADLVLAGRRGSAFDELESTIGAAGSRDRIRLVEDVSDRSLNGLYRGALALLHPSRYEGFGFTPLEAMTRGVRWSQATFRRSARSRATARSSFHSMTSSVGRRRFAASPPTGRFGQISRAEGWRRQPGTRGTRQPGGSASSCSSSDLAPGEHPDVPLSHVEPGKEVEDGRTAVPPEQRRDVLAPPHDRLVARLLDAESVIREETLVAAKREGPDVCVVIRDPTLGVGRRRVELSALREDAARLSHERRRIAYVLEDVLEDDPLEGSVAEGQWLALDVGVKDLAAERGRVLDGGRIHLDACVLAEVVREPPGATTDVQQTGARREVPREIAPVPWLLMPVRVRQGGED